MSDALRKFSCRIGFLLFCLLPTTLVLGWIVVARSSYYREARRAALEQQLSGVLAVDVSIGAWTGLPGGGLLLEDLRLSDPETSEQLTAIRLLEVREDEAGLNLLASQPEFSESALPRLWELLHDRLLRQTRLRTTRFAAQEVTLRAARGAQTFTEVLGELSENSSGPQLAFQFRLAGSQMTEPAHFRLVRNRQLDPPATGWSLRTGNSPLPCHLVAEQLPLLRALGPDCRFQGTVWASLTGRGWEGDLSGQFLDLDLHHLVSHSFPHKLTGAATAVITVARFEQGQLLEAAGELRSEHGVISRSLLIGVRDQLGLSLNQAALPADEQRVLYQKLGLAFLLDDEGLRVTAVRDARQPGVLVWGDFGWLCSESAAGVVPAAALVRALVPDSQWQVPATRQTNALLLSLPVPEIVPDAQETPREAYVPLRLRQDQDPPPEPLTGSHP